MKFIKHSLIILLILCYTVGCAQNKITIAANDLEWINHFKESIETHTKNKNNLDTLFITFKKGTYYLKEELQLLELSKGKSVAPIVINGEQDVKFSGGIQLVNKDFSFLKDQEILNRIIDQKAKSKILVYDLKLHGITDFGTILPIGFGRNNKIAPIQLFHNGERMTLARYPNETDRSILKLRTSVIPISKITNKGIANVDLPLDSQTDLNKNKQLGAFQYSDKRIEKWLTANDVWVDGIFSRDWSWSLNKINAIDTVQKTITLKFDEKYDLTNKNSFFFAVNILEEIDSPGEYYIDRQTGKLYFYPPVNFDFKKSVVSLSNNVKSLFFLKKMQNIEFKNIAFELGRNTAVELQDCRNILFENCNFMDFGNAALTINGIDNTVKNCIIHSIGGTAISLDGGDLVTLTSGNNKVEGCDIYDWAYYNRVYTPAIALRGVGNIVSKNHIFQAPHGAITITGNNHIIENNEINDVLQEFRDFGAIYGFLGKNPMMRGHVIMGNYFHHIGAISDGVYAIYADEGTAGWQIENNVFYKIGNNGNRVAAILGNTSSYTNVNHNLFVDCSETLELSFHFSTWGKKRYTDYFMKSWKEQFKDDKSIPQLYLDAYPALKTYMSEERVYVNTNSFTNNTVGNFSINLNHTNFFKTQSDLANADSLIQAKNNSYTKDKALPDFLDNWNSKAKKAQINIPDIIKNYKFFNQ